MQSHCPNIYYCYCYCSLAALRLHLQAQHPYSGQKDLAKEQTGQSTGTSLSWEPHPVTTTRNHLPGQGHVAAPVC